MPDFSTRGEIIFNTYYFWLIILFYFK